MKKPDKNLIIVLAFGFTVSLFFYNNIFSPLAKGNKELAGNLKINKDKKHIIESMFKDQERLGQIKKDMTTLEIFLRAKITEEKKISQLTKLLGRSSVAVQSINSGPVQQMRMTLPQAKSEISYEAVSVSVSLRGSMEDLIKYLDLCDSNAK